MIRLGFLTYVDEGAAPMVVTRGSSLRYLLSRDARGCPLGRSGLAATLRASGVKDKAKVFHSFRHTVKDALRRGRADHEMREALIGHAQASTVSWGYGANAMLSRFSAEALSDAINRISYPGLDLSRVKPLRTPTNSAATRENHPFLSAKKIYKQPPRGKRDL